MTKNLLFVPVLWGLLFAAPVLAKSAGPFVSPNPSQLVYNPQREVQLSMAHILENIHHPQISRGAVIASPSRQEPDYFFHWVRDAALTIGTLTDQLPRYPQLGEVIRNWVGFERLTQRESQNGIGLGEPKFHVDGTVFRGPWGRPQNDGPAIRAWAFLRAFGTFDPMVQNDLEYLRSNWAAPDFDLWEEVKGEHFFTRYAQMASFRLAGQVLMKQGQGPMAHAYMNEAARIESTLSGFIDRQRISVVPTVRQTEGVAKPTGIDISVILAVIYFGPTNNWSVSQSYVMGSVLRLEEAFKQIYRVNQVFPEMAPGIGRYPEDVYDGNGFSGGNPWFLATFGLAEYYCSLAEDLTLRGGIRLDAVNKALFKAASPGLTLPKGLQTLSAKNPEYWTLMQGLQAKGQSFIQRALFHAGEDRRYAEQFDRQSGYRRGARDLTWSYAASIRAIQKCHGGPMFRGKVN